jgi:UDP-N-acetylglucosamine diphosphorylase / glucose-1-phosphate thymidylyltransferase / UDP-N-acetylgalactosamine diphosphorylase / glucosamine-1-phosphate N-acetyltransferase / galactosamine-1-phosphate N-acetyltransferase
MEFPTPRSVFLVEDRGGSFGPLTDLRPAYELRCGICTIAERILARCTARLEHADVNPSVVALAEKNWDGAHVTALMERTIVHARLLTVGVLDGLAVGERRFRRDGTFLAARLPKTADQEALAAAVATPPTVAECAYDADIATAPWDLTTRVGVTLEEDLSILPNVRSFHGAVTRALRPDEGQSFGAHPIIVHPSASIGPTCVFDASKGAIVIARNAVIRPLSVIVGPCVIGESSIVSERALLKASTVIGPHCRVGGEVGGTIFQGFSNKSHDGHLGDSFVGEWVNIGAGSDNSNLLNTYGEVIVRLESDSGLVRTGRQFWGSVIGDHVKLAIGTRLMTGTTIGTGAMIACSKPPATLVPRFSWLTDSTDGPKSFRIDKFLETARAMMSRRSINISPAYEACIRALHARSTATGA